ncbi:MAG: hypothetical protein QUS08_00010 [Methanothrix sp.]|nr:hypothetical protein [Methanothrix sp.]
MKLQSALTLVLMLSPLAAAAPESVQLGPYAVSFDMNTDIPYQIQQMEPIQTDSVLMYGLQIFTDNSTKARITISEYTSQIDSTLGVYKQLSAMGLALNGFNVTDVQDRSIDGRSGFIIGSEPFPENTAAPAGAVLFDALYWLDSVDCECGPVSVGTTSVDIMSSYQQDITESLVGSLHVEKVQASAQGMPPAGDMPPVEE